jgi:hypothetical protein
MIDLAEPKEEVKGCGVEIPIFHPSSQAAVYTPPILGDK